MILLREPRKRRGQKQIVDVIANFLAMIGSPGIWIEYATASLSRNLKCQDSCVRIQNVTMWNIATSPFMLSISFASQFHP
jgi:hypothetical protein